MSSWLRNQVPAMLEFTLRDLRKAPRWATVEELSRSLGTGPYQVQTLLRESEVSHQYRGRLYEYDREELVQIIEARLAYLLRKYPDA